MAEALATSPELVLAHLDSLPTLPAVALRLLQVTALDDCTVGDVIQLLRADQSLTAKILSVANSAAAGTRGVTTLERAVPLVGFGTIRSIVLATGVFECFARGGADRDGEAFDRLEFWKHSLAVACASRQLARLRDDFDLNPEDAFVAGLLHDLGKVALDAVFPKAYDRIAARANHARGDIADSERAILGADHTVAGRRLAERWRLPRELQESIWLHHLAADALPGSVARPALIGVVQLADTIAREQRIGYSGNHVFYEMSPRLAERLGYSDDQVNHVVKALAGEVAAQTELLDLDRETPESVYVKAMTRANAELGRLNADLLAGNRRLAAAARNFKALASFEDQLSDWADPLAVVIAIAHAASLALQRAAVAVIGIREGGTIVDICWTRGAGGEPGYTTQPAHDETAAVLEELRTHQDSLVVPAGPAMRAVMAAAVHPQERGTPWLVPLRHQGLATGGIVFASETDERARLAEEAEELRAFLASLGLAIGRANAQAAAQRLSEDLAETNRRLQQMQVELLRSRTLSMIAEMAAGAGHELNTPLTVISGRAQMLGSTLQDPAAQRVLQMISEKAHECSGIVSELMDFARPRPPKLAPVPVPELLAELRDEFLARAKLPAARLRLESASVACAPHDGSGVTPIVLADREQLRVVFRELLANAVEAVGANSGSIVLRCQAGLDIDTVEVRIEDTGCGMPPAVLQRAFDPFFSHRIAGRSRGLGLPRAYRIVEAHHGRIWLESQPGEGTTAHVLLPGRVRGSPPAANA